jgi:hypothetical protein
VCRPGGQHDLRGHHEEVGWIQGSHTFPPARHCRPLLVAHAPTCARSQSLVRRFERYGHRSHSPDTALANGVGQGRPQTTSPAVRHNVGQPSVSNDCCTMVL